jgi:hypothetical protein
MEYKEYHQDVPFKRHPLPKVVKCEVIGKICSKSCVVN